MITYESICEKLGFDPLTADPKTVYPPARNPYMVDDSIPSPFSVLTDEEADFIHQIMREEFLRREKNTSASEPLH